MNAHTRLQYRHRSPGSPERIFPLLCPVREHDWLEDWRAEVIQSDSGGAERGCVFMTPARDAPDPVTWVVHRYDPPTAIGFSILLPGVFVELLDVELRPLGDETELVWTREATALGSSGIGAVRQRAVHHGDKHAALARALDHYLVTGRCLSAGQ